jgi:hypothetical protein
VELDRRYLRLSLNQILFLPLDWAGLRSYAQLLQVLFSSFWFGFGWGEVVVGRIWEWAMTAVVLASIAGLALAGIRSWQAAAIWQRRVVWLFVVTIAVSWLAVVVRFELERTYYVPRGRYLHLALAPTIWLLVAGFERLIPRRWQFQGMFSLAVFFALLDIMCWAGVLSAFYYR